MEELTKKFLIPVTVVFAYSREVSYEIIGVSSITYLGDDKGIFLEKADGNIAHIKDYVFFDVTEG